jgi:hypothetical protein
MTTSRHFLFPVFQIKNTKVMKKIVCLLAVLSLGFSQEDPIRKTVENLPIESQEERAFKTLVTDGEWGKPFYLYSRTGIPYRCFVRVSEGLPLQCRRTEAGEETIDAMKQKQS